MFLFVTACDDDSNGKKTDIVAPTVVSVNPSTLATAVVINTQIVATFNEEMDPATITTTSFTIDAGGNSVAGTVTYTGTTATFTPEGDLAGDTLHTATITTAAMDLEGNALENSYTWIFTTVPDPDIIAPKCKGNVGDDRGVVHERVGDDSGQIGVEGDSRKDVPGHFGETDPGAELSKEKTRKNDDAYNENRVNVHVYAPLEVLTGQH